MDVWEEAEKLHEEIELDFNSALNYYKLYGYIYSTPTSLLWGEDLHDSWYVYLAIGKGCIKRFIESQPYWLSTTTFCRGLKSKLEPKKYSMERIAKFYNINTETIKAR